MNLNHFVVPSNQDNFRWEPFTDGEISGGRLGVTTSNHRVGVVDTDPAFEKAKHLYSSERITMGAMSEKMNRFEIVEPTLNV